MLVIGGFGFIGVNLTERLARLGARVTVVTPSLRPASRRGGRRRARAASASLEGDLRDAGRDADRGGGQDVVFNLAGQSGAVRSMEDPWTDLDVNCRGNLVLLEALRRGEPGRRSWSS